MQNSFLDGFKFVALIAAIGFTSTLLHSVIGDAVHFFTFPFSALVIYYATKIQRKYYS